MFKIPTGFFKKAKATIRQRVQIPIDDGVAEFTTFYGLSDGAEHLAISFLNPEALGSKETPPLVRMHSECLTGDVFGSAKCDCGDQLSEALSMIKKENGILLYLRQEGRGIGLYNKLDAYDLQAKGLDTYEANRQLGFGMDLRNYKSAAEMLKAMGITEIRLLSNNPDKHAQLEANGIRVVLDVETGVFITNDNIRYLQAKVLKTSHRLNLKFSPVLG